MVGKSWVGLLQAYKLDKIPSDCWNVLLSSFFIWMGCLSENSESAGRQADKQAGIANDFFAIVRCFRCFF